jgi:protein-histidine N-methyltransferase
MNIGDFQTPGARSPRSFVVADYNPTVLQLATLPNFILAWALQQKETEPTLQQAFSMEGELEFTDGVLEAFQAYLVEMKISLTFVSGGWSPQFVDLVYGVQDVISPTDDRDTLVLGAETIYSPFALNAFSETVFDVLRRAGQQWPACSAKTLVAAKRHYFGVGGSIDDFIERAKRLGAAVTQLREEAGGVRRAVVECLLEPRVDVEMNM